MKSQIYFFYFHDFIHEFTAIAFIYIFLKICILLNENFCSKIARELVESTHVDSCTKSLGFLSYTI
jgi:ABC-type glycerol-3-phosphate transport system permease component